MASIWFYRVDKGRIAYDVSGCGTEIDFVLVGKGCRGCVGDVGLISWNFSTAGDCGSGWGGSGEGYGKAADCWKRDLEVE